MSRPPKRRTFKNCGCTIVYRSSTQLPTAVERNVWTKTDDMWEKLVEKRWNIYKP